MPTRPFNSYCVLRILVHAETRRRGGFDRAQVRFLIRLRGFAASRLRGFACSSFDSRRGAEGAEFGAGRHIGLVLCPRNSPNGRHGISTIDMLAVPMHDWLASGQRLK
jgi:hypothetical protein